MYNFPVAYLNSNDSTGLLAFGEGPKLRIDQLDNLEQVQNFIDSHAGSYLVSAFSYDCKNAIEQLSSNNPDSVNFPDVFLWKPKYVVKIDAENFSFVQGTKNAESFDFLNYFLEEETDSNFHPYHLNFEATISEKEYIRQVEQLQKHIQLGDIYEVNYCQEFVANGIEINYPLDAYFKLNGITKAPFSTFFAFDDLAIFCGSPERFLMKKGNELLSQPIKGTAKRGATADEDLALKNALQSDPKERAENIMIVDLVRNDLSKIAKKGTVDVQELCEIYTFETVHQMISTIRCELQDNTVFTDVFQALFPMGSMTGAPKISAMRLIEKHEAFKRGMYSGTVGYIDPNGDFDFNVVIRTLLYNAKLKRMSCAVGSAITILSDPKKEYEECETKIRRLLDGMNETSE